MIVITGHQDALIRNALRKKPVRFVHAPDFADGISASLRAGIVALDNQVQGALICLGDMPLVDPHIMRQIIEAYDPTQRHEIVLPVYENQRGNPVLWGKRFFPELSQLTGDAGGHKILHRHKSFIAEIAVGSEAVRLDFDTPAALAAFKNDP